MSYTNRKFNWDFDELKRFYNNYVVKWINSAMSWTDAQKKQARSNLGFGNGDIDSEPTDGSDNPVKSGGVHNELALGAVYDVSAKNPTAGPNNDGKWESLSALLSDANLNTLIPTSVRKGGMSIKFIQSSDNKYVQYRLMKNQWSTSVADWQGVDSEPTAGSENLVKSGGVIKQTTPIIETDYSDIPTTPDSRWTDNNGVLGYSSSSMHLQRTNGIFVEEGCEIVISANLNGAEVAYGYICDAENNILATISASGRYIAPANAAYLFCNYYSNFECIVKGSMIVNENTFAKRQDYSFVGFTEGSKWINDNGVISYSSGTNIRRFNPVSVNAGDLINITPYNKGFDDTFESLFLCDDAGNILYSTGTYNKVNDVNKVVVPEGVTKVYFNSLAQNNFIFAIDRGVLANTNTRENTFEKKLESGVAYKAGGNFAFKFRSSDFRQGNISLTEGQEIVSYSASAIYLTKHLVVVEGSTLFYSINSGYRLAVAYYDFSGKMLGKYEWYTGSGNIPLNNETGSIGIVVASSDASSITPSDFDSSGLILSTNKEPVQTRAFGVEKGNVLETKMNNVEEFVDNEKVLANRADYSSIHTTERSKYIDDNGVIGTGESGSIKRCDAIDVAENDIVRVVVDKHGMTYDAGLFTDAVGNIISKINSTGTFVVPRGATLLYFNCVMGDAVGVVVESGSLVQDVEELKDKLRIPIYAPFPQLPANDDPSSDFNCETVQSTDFHEAFEALIDELQNPGEDSTMLPKYANVFEKTGIDASGELEIKAYVFSRRNRYAWKAADRLYAWKNLLTNLVIYTDSCSPRVGDKCYYDANRTDYGLTVGSYNTSIDTFVGSNDTTYTRDKTRDVDAVVVYSQSAMNAAGTSNLPVFDKSGNSLGTSTAVDGTHISLNSVTYERCESLDFHTDQKGTIVLWGNEHGPQSDPCEPSVVLYRMAKDLVDGCGNNLFLQYLKEYYKVVMVPAANPYGVNNFSLQGREGRTNYNNVNINRNYSTPGWFVQPAESGNAKGSYPGDQPETQFLMNIVKFFDPVVAIDIHCLGYVARGSIGCCAHEGHIPNSAADAVVAETMRGLSQYYISYGDADPSTGCWAGDWLYQEGISGGIIEMSPGKYAASYNGKQHTPHIMFAAYTLLLNTIRMWLYGFDDSIDLSKLCIK